MIYIFQGRSYGLGRGSADELYFKIEHRFCDHLSEFSGSALKVLLCLASHIDKDGYCFPSLDTICAKSGLGRQCVSQAITELCGLSIEGQRVLMALQPKAENGGFTNNRYILFPGPGDLEKYAGDERRPRQKPAQTVPDAPGQPAGGSAGDDEPQWLRDLQDGAEQPPQVGADLQKDGILPDYPSVAFPSTVEPSTVNESLTRINLNNITNDANASFEGQPTAARAVKKGRNYKEPPVDLLPDTEIGFYLFNRLGDEYHAKNRRAPANFGSLEQKSRWAKIESEMPPAELIQAVDTVLNIPILALSRIILYIEKIRKTGGMNVRPVPSGSRADRGGGSSAPRPGTPEFKAYAEASQAEYERKKAEGQAAFRAMQAAKNGGGAGLTADPE